MTSPRSYFEKELSTEPPVGPELGSTFSWRDEVFGGWENGKVFALPDHNFDDYKEMIETDGKAASIELLLSYPIISAPWEIQPFKGDNGEAEFIWDALTNLPHQGGPRTTIEQLVSQMTSAFTYKRAYFEKVFKVNDDDKVVYDKLAWRPPETCELMLDDRTASVLGFRQYPVTWSQKPFLGPNGKGYVDVGNRRAFIYTHGTWRDPIFGFSSMSVPYWCYITKRKLRWLWYQFLDQTMLPKTIVKNPDELQARNDAKKVAQLRSKGVLGVSDQTIVEAYESSGHGATGYIDAIRYLESEMSNSILGGFMDLTSSASEGKGSFALAENQSKLFLRTRRMVARDMARQLTNNVIGDLVRYNFGKDAAVPRFTFGPLSEQNEQAVLDMFRGIASTGANVDPEFYDELQTRVAALLELDAGKVQRSLEAATNMPGAESPGELQKLAAQVDVATTMVEGAQASGDAPPPANGIPAPQSPPGKHSVASSGGTQYKPAQKLQKKQERESSGRVR